MRLLLDGILHVRMITHEGKLLAVGMRRNGQIVYTVRRDGFEDTSEQRQLESWENWQPLPLPGLTGVDSDPSVQKLEREDNIRQHADGSPALDENGDLQYLTRSLYDSHRLHAIAPIAVVSGMDHVHVFRVARDKDPEGLVMPLPVLVDRFVLDGMANRLVPKLDIRYRRSRKRHEPLASRPGTSLVVDSLDFRDANDQPFSEPTTELGFLDARLRGFSVELAPAGEPDRFNWHIATTVFRDSLEVLVLTTIGATEYGGFAINDRSSSAAIVQREYSLSGWRPDGVPAMTRFDRQAERLDASGEKQYMRVSTSLMVALPVSPVQAGTSANDAENRRVATLQFPIRKDGTLAPLADEDSERIRLRGVERRLAIPPDTLSAARAITMDVQRGAIDSIRRSNQGGIRITAASAPDDSLSASESIEFSLDDTPSLDGNYPIERVRLGHIMRDLRVGGKATYLAVRLTESLPAGTRLQLGDVGVVITTRHLRSGLRMLNLEPTDVGGPAGTPVFLADSFSIPAPVGQLGSWKGSPDVSTARMDGQVLALQVSGDRLRLDAPGHGLSPGDRVDISGHRTLDGTYRAIQHDVTFELEKGWPAIEANNAGNRRQSLSGLVFGDADTRIEIQRGDILDTSRAFSIELLVRSNGDAVLACWSRKLPGNAGSAALPTQDILTLSIFDGHLRLSSVELSGSPLLDDQNSIADGQWHHVAVVVSANSLPRRSCTVVIDGIAQDAIDLEHNLPSLAGCTLLLGNDSLETLPLGAHQGELADVRLWQRALAATQLADHTAIPVHVESRDLLCFWRLGALLDSSEGRTATDATVEHNDGVVSGRAWTTPVSFDRHMRDGFTPVERVENPALFGVTQGSTYTEQFEFRFTGLTGSLQIAMWGQTSRHDNKRIDIDAVQSITDSPDKNWQIATVTYTVPDDVTLMRTFGIDVEGEWYALQLRRHQIRTGSDTSSILRSNASITLQGIGEEHAGGAELVRNYAQQQAVKRALERRQSRLSDWLANALDADRQKRTLNSLNIAQADNVREQQKIRNKVAVLEKDWLSYWISVFITDDRLPRGQAPLGALESDDQGRLIISLDPAADLTGKHVNRFQWRMERDRSGRHIKLYSNTAGAGQRSLTTEQTSKVTGLFDPKKIFGISKFIKGLRTAVIDATQPAQAYWKPSFSVSSAIDQRWGDGTIDAGQGPLKLFHFGSSADVTVAWFMAIPAVVTADIAPTKFSFIASGRLHNLAADRLREMNLRLADLEQQHRSRAANIRTIESLNAGDSQRLQAQLLATENHLDQILAQLSIAQERFNVSLSSNAGASISLSPADYPGIPASGALLEHVDATSEISLYASATGNVLLSHYDARGLVRQSQFDAVSGDTDLTSEQWQVDGLYRCLAGNTRATLAAASESDRWTFECWLLLPVIDDQLLLAVADKDKFEGFGIGHAGGTSRPDQFILVTRKSGEAQLHIIEGADLADVAPGWHHVAIVAGADSPVDSYRVYLDGIPHGNPVSSLTANAEAASPSTPVSNQPDPDSAEPRQPWNTFDSGRGIAEVRLWNTALDPEEIQTNSRIRLTGLEPGLLAYHPLNGNLNDPGGRPDLSVGNPVYEPCDAPIGNPGHRVAVFDGLRRDEFVVGFSSRERSMDTWVRFNTDVPDAQIILTLPMHLPEGWGRWVVFLAAADDSGIQQLTCSTRINAQERRAELPLVADGVWHHLIARIGSGGEVQLWLDGQPSHIGDTLQAITQELNIADDAWLIGGGSQQQSAVGGLKAELAELRTWGSTTWPDELLKRRFRRATSGYVRRLAFDEAGTTQQPARLVYDLPLSDTDVQVAEYPTYGLDTLGQRVAIMRRCTAVATSSGLELWAQQRVEELDLRWVGNAQFEPTLLGFIEGAPPVPSENLTEEADGYNDATSVTLTVSDEVELAWNRSKESSHGFGMDFFIGYENEWEVGANAPLLGRLLSWKAGGLRAGLAGNFAADVASFNETTVAASSAVTRSDTLALRGQVETEPAFEGLGARFVPKNIGYALVVAGLADVFISRLAKSGRMVGYQIVPVSDVPPDVSTITFLINPAYTMNGSLDGMTGIEATSNRFFSHVPDARRQWGSRYPASYFRLQEAYALRERIRQDDKRREAFFENFVVTGNFADDSLDAQIDDPDYAPKEIKLDSKDGNLQPASDGETDTGKEEPTDLRDLENVAGDKADDAEEKAEEIREQIDEQTEDKKKLVEAKKKEIAQLRRPEQREHAESSFRAWQHKMEDLQIRAGKRNIVNSYVWDADGGLRAESEEFASTVEHTVGSGVDMSWAVGADLAFNVSGFQLELSPMYQGSVSQTLSKTRSTSSALSLEVDLSGLESNGITDFRDHPLMPGTKVDRYRFMSFYLDGSERNFDDFFNDVVDPEWLASNDEEARALRQTAQGAKSKPWRILHRVTQVERPALSGFGRDLRPLPDIAEPSELERQLSALEARIELLASDNVRMARQLDERIRELKTLLDKEDQEDTEIT